MQVSALFFVAGEHSQESQPIRHVSADAPCADLAAAAACGSFPVALNSTDRGDSPPTVSAVSTRCAQKPRGTEALPAKHAQVRRASLRPRATERVPPCRWRSVPVIRDSMFNMI